ncbi:hypothetical protein ACP3V3_17030 [Vibrio sp. PNB22_3_1]
MTQAKNIFSYSDEDALPLYHHYALQHQPQLAYITLDIATGEVDADYTREIGNAIPVSVWRRCILRFTISPQLRASAIHNLIEDHLNHFQNILNGAEIAWENSNQVGIFTHKASLLIEQLDFRLEDKSNQLAVTVIDCAEDICNYFDDEIFFPSIQDPLTYAQELIDSIDTSVAMPSQKLSKDAGMLDALTELWCEILYRGDNLPQHVAQYLLDHGDCEDSGWMDELTAMAKGNPL